MAALTPEQQTLVSAVPDAYRALTYCAVAKEDYASFFQNNAGYDAKTVNADLRKSGYSADGVYELLWTEIGSGLARNSERAQYLFELHCAMRGKYTSLTDMSGERVYYEGTPQNMTKAELEAQVKWLDDTAARVKSNQNWAGQIAIWRALHESWLIYRGGSAVSQMTEEERQALEAYGSEAFVKLDGERGTLLDAMPELYKPVTYAALTQTSGLAWFREASGADADAVLRYWNMDEQALSQSALALLRDGKAYGAELLLLEQVYLVKRDAIGVFAYETASRYGSFYLDSSRTFRPVRPSSVTLDMQNLSSTTAELEAVRDDAQQLSARAASLRELAQGRSEFSTAATLWADYADELSSKRSASVTAYLKARDEASAAAQQERQRLYAAAQEMPDGGTYRPTLVPSDRGYSSVRLVQLNRTPQRYLASACLLLDSSLSESDYFTNYTAEEYRADAQRYLALGTKALEAEYLRLLALKNEGGALERDANLLMLVSEMLQTRWRGEGYSFVVTHVTVASDGTRSLWHSKYYDNYDRCFRDGDGVQIGMLADGVRNADNANTAPYRDFIALCEVFAAYNDYTRANGGSAVTGGATYLLEACTGQGNGRRIEFFRIVYDAEVDGKSVECTQYLFPTEDSLASGYAAAAKVGEQTERLERLRAMGYEPLDVSAVTALGSFRTDQFLFEADRPIGTVKEIQAFMSHSGDGSTSWTCYALRLYRVERIAGLLRCGYYSSEPYIDFEGSLVAQVLFGDEDGKDGMMTSPTHELTLDESDVLFRFGGARGIAGCTLASYAQGERVHLTQGGDNIIFRVDFADQYNAGLECLATPWNGDKTLTGSGVCETFALRVRYRDIYGAVRQTTLPMITSTALWAANEGGLGDAQHAGFAQQGESIAFSCLLPDYQSIINVVPTFGSSAAAAQTKLTAVSGDAAAARDAAAERSESDEAGVTCIAVYDPRDGALQARLDDGFVRYSFPAVPTDVYRVREATGTRYYAGGTNPEITLTPVGSEVKTLNLTPAAEQERYLVTLTTDDVEMGGTVSDVTLRLAYEDLEGYQRETGTVRIRDYVNDFYGYWSASVADFGYRYGLSVARGADGSVTGNSVSFLLPVKDVKRFTGVTLGLAGDDEWQVRNVSVRAAESVGPRTLRWESGMELSGGQTDRILGREVTGRLVFDLASGGTASASGTDAAVGGERTFEPLLIQQGDVSTLEVDAPEVYEKQDVDWRELRYNMTYADAMQDLGFMKARCTYTVEVQVASDLANLSGDDDCGSKNQFYFQLLFADGGASGVVLANQQLESDGFHSGVTEAFTITTSQDYGDVTAVRIIPEDLASDSDKYDKLKIDRIVVKRSTNGELTPLWRVNDVGWIGIDYRDEGSAESISGVDGRTMEELSHVYPVSESSYAVNVQFAVSTGQYIDRSSEHNGEATPQFEGELEAWVYYRDTQGRIQKYHVADVVELMYAFNNRAASYAEVETEGRTTNGKAVSDPDYMFRACRTDRFEVSLDGLDTLLYVNFFARSSVNCTWNVSDVSAWLVRGQGRRVLNVAGEYSMKYPEGQELELIGRADSQMEPKYYKQLYRGVAAGKSAPTMSVNFTAASVTLDDSVLESQAVVRRIPATGSDTLNLVLYPENAAANYELTATARYTYGDSIVDSSGRMNRGSVDGESVFYLEGLSMNGASVLNSIGVIADTSAPTQLAGGFAQRVRGGFVVETYELGGTANVELGVSVPFAETGGEKQRLTFQLSPETQALRLVPEKTDIAVSFTYRTDGPIEREYQSPRVFLTDQGVTGIEPGQIVELTFAQGRVREITGVSAYVVGPVNAALEGGYAVCERTSGEDARFSFPAESAVTAGGVTHMSAAAQRQGDGVEPLILRFTTGGGADNLGGGTGGAVSMSVGYYDSYGEARVRYYEDLRPYLTGEDKTFRANSEREARILMTGVGELRWIELNPLTTDGGATVWNLQRVSARVGEDGQEAERAVSEPLVGGTTYRFPLANIRVSATVEYPAAVVNEQTGLAEPGVRNAELSDSMSVLLASGDTVRVTPQLVGSREGVTVALYRLDAASGAVGSVELRDTRGYTAESIAESIERAASPEEAAVWRGVQPDTGSWSRDGETWVFTPPRNYTGGSMSYRIVVASVEAEGSSVTLDVTVTSESDPVAKELDYARTRAAERTAAEAAEAARAAEQPQETQEA